MYCGYIGKFYLGKAGSEQRKKGSRFARMKRFTCNSRQDVIYEEFITLSNPNKTGQNFIPANRIM